MIIYYKIHTVTEETDVSHIYKNHFVLNKSMAHLQCHMAHF